MTKEERKKQLAEDKAWLAFEIGKLDSGAVGIRGTKFTPVGVASMARKENKVREGDEVRYWGKMLQVLQLDGILKKLGPGMYLSILATTPLAPVKATERVDTQPLKKPEEARIGSPVEYQEIAKALVENLAMLRDTFERHDVPVHHPTHGDSILSSFRNTCRERNLVFRGFGEDVLQNYLADAYVTGAIRAFRRDRDEDEHVGNPSTVEFVYQSATLPPLTLGGWSEIPMRRRDVPSPLAFLTRRGRGRKVIGDVKQ